MWLMALFACTDPDAPTVPGDDAEVEFEVPKGATANGLGATLVDQGFVSGAWTWKLYVRQNDLSCLKAGKFRLKKSMSLNQLKSTLCGVPIADEVPFTVVEGWRIRDIDEALVAKGWIEPGEYTKVATEKAVDAPFEVPSTTLEGYLWPETYSVTPEKFTAKGFAERQLGLFKTKFLDGHGTDECIAKRGLNGVVVMASMLEREEPSPENRPVVAGILWKRVDAGWKLGVDATSRYTLADWNDRKAFLTNLRDPEEPYNTRLRDGLPPTAIGNPALPSLLAACSPQPSDWWYYLHDGQRQFHGSRDAAEHEANRKKFDIW